MSPEHSFFKENCVSARSKNETLFVTCSPSAAVCYGALWPVQESRSCCVSISPLCGIMRTRPLPGASREDPDYASWLRILSSGLWCSLFNRDLIKKMTAEIFWNLGVLPGHPQDAAWGKACRRDLLSLCGDLLRGTLSRATLSS